MVPPLYTPLPTDTFTIRLLQLLPSTDPSAPLHCKLVTYPLSERQSSSHLYECLSYVWGSPENPQPPIVHHKENPVVELQLTRNLHSALLHLRNPVLERSLWVDAVCINQDDFEERAHQVTSMARIYGLAQRVIAWLGEETNECILAFRELGTAALKHDPTSESMHGLLTWQPDMRAQVEVSDETMHLLSLPYFQRVWILQEMAAARNLIFRCGSYEMQWTTFLSGLAAFTLKEHSQSSMLQGQIRAVIRLLWSSSTRESLKGQAHINILPLAELIDMFNAHNSTDSRDKIYALLGLCSDSGSALQLQPNYEKPWKKLLEELGGFIFGKKAVVSASRDRQILFVREYGYDLGQISELAAPSREKDTQTVWIRSMRVGRVLNAKRDWSVDCRLRTSARSLQNHDLVLYLPDSKRLVFVRPATYYLRIVMITESRYVYFEKKEEPGSWIPCDAWLTGMDETRIHFPMVWNWLEPYEKEEQEALLLMRKEVPEPPSPIVEGGGQDTLYKVKALQAMASLFMVLDEHQEASRYLESMVDIFKNAYGSDGEATMKSYTQLAATQQNHKRYIIVKDALSYRTKNKNIVHKCQVVIQLAEGTMPSPSSDDDFLDYEKRTAYRYTETRPKVVAMWVDLASKVLCHGVSKDMILATQHPLFTYDWYLSLLLSISDSTFAILKSELVAAAHTKISVDNFIQLAKHTPGPINYLPMILKGFKRSRGLEDKGSLKTAIGIDNNLVRILSELGDRVPITSEAINAAVRTSAPTLSALLEGSKHAGIVTTKTFQIATIDWQQNIAGQQNDTYCRILQILVKHARPGCQISEDALIILSSPANYSERYIGTPREWTFHALLEQLGSTIVITEPIIMSMIERSRNNDEHVLLLMRFRRDVRITRNMYQKAERIADRVSRTNTISFLKSLEQGEAPIKQQEVEFLPSYQKWAYINMLTLLRDRRAEFVITEEMISRAIYATDTEEHLDDIISLMTVNTKGSFSHEDIVDKFGSLLVKHAELCVIQATIRNAELLEHAAFQGCTAVLKVLHDHVLSGNISLTTMPTDSKLEVSPDGANIIQVMHLLTKIFHHLYWKDIDGDFEEVSSPISNEIAEFARIEAGSVPLLLKFKLFERALIRDTSEDHKFLNMLFDHQIVNPYSVNAKRQTPLHRSARVCRGKNTARMLECIVENGILVAIDMEDEQGITPRQLFTELMDSENFSRYEREYIDKMMSQN